MAYASYQADANLNGDTISPSGLANITLNEACTSQADLLSFCAPVPLLPYSTLAGFPSTFKFDTIGAQLSYLLQVLEGAYVDDRFFIPLVEFIPKNTPFEFNDFAVTASSSIFPPFATIETLKAHHNAVSNPQTANKILDLINLDLQKALER